MSEMQELESAAGKARPETVGELAHLARLMSSGDLEGVVGSRLLRALTASFGELAREDLERIAAADSDAEVLSRMVEVPSLAAALEARDPLVRARLRGFAAKRSLLEVEGGTVSSAEAGEMLGIDRVAVDKRRKRGKLLAVRVGQRGFRYPLWQFDADSPAGIIAGLPEVLASFGVEDGWMRLSFMLSRNERLGGRRPLDALRHGESEAVRLAASAYGEHAAE